MINAYTSRGGRKPKDEADRLAMLKERISYYQKMIADGTYPEGGLKNAKERLGDNKRALSKLEAKMHYAEAQKLAKNEVYGRFA